MSPAGPTVPPPWLNASSESSRPGCAAGLLPQGLGLQARSSKFHSEGAHSPASPSWSVKKRKKIALSFCGMAPFGFCLSKETRLSCCHHEEIKIKQACKHGDFFFFPFSFFFLFSESCTAKLGTSISREKIARPRYPVTLSLCRDPRSHVPSCGELFVYYL